jgi:hypothetical protein
MTAYIWPVDPSTKGQGFGDNPGPPYNPVGGHTGDDFKVAPGTPVHAIGDGTVRAIGQLPEPYTSNAWWIEGQWAGNVVIIDHGPIVSVYAHLSEWRVNLGDTVTQGQVIALSGATGGASTGPHLHFEILPDRWDFNNGTYGRVNPAIYCTAIQEDDMSAEDVAAIRADIATVHQSVLDGIQAARADVATVHTTIIRDVGGQLGNMPAAVLNAKFTLPDGTVTNLAGILGAINAKPLTSAGTVANVTTDLQAIAVAVAAEIKAQWNK